MPAPSPQQDESQGDYMDRCQLDGNPESECQAKWDEGTGTGASYRRGYAPMGIKELRQARAEVAQEMDQETSVMNAMLSNPASTDAVGTACFSETQEGQYGKLEISLKGHKAQLKGIDQQIDRHETLMDAEKTVKAVRAGRSDMGDSPALAELRPRQPKVFHNFGEQLRAIYDQALGFSNPKGLSNLNSINAAAIGAGESIGADGGFLVQQDFSSEIFRKMHEGADILGRVRNTPVSGNGLILPSVVETSRATGSRWGGVTSSWTAEGIAPTASKPQFGTIEWVLKRITALGYASEELLQDTSAMASIFTEAFSEELRWRIEDAIFNGSGAGEPMGILNGGSTVSVPKETGQPAATVVVENIVKMYSRMFARSRGNSAWYINQDIEPQLFTMSLAVGTGGAPVYMPPGGLSASPFGTLMGRPVIATEYQKTLGTEGDIVLADLSQYMTIDKGGVQQDSSIHVRFTTAEQAFRAMMRIDGKPLWKTALTPANGTNTQSPFVTLAVRA